MKTLDLFHDTLETPITKVISGGARGIDTFAKDWALQRKYDFQEYRPRYEYFEIKRQAPLARNAEMAVAADRGLILWDGISTGSMHMKRCLETLRKPVEIILLQVSKIRYKKNQKMVDFFLGCDINRTMMKNKNKPIEQLEQFNRKPLWHADYIPLYWVLVT